MSGERQEALVLEGVEIRLGARLLLSLSATILPGAVLTVMGPSGSGKSTLLACLGGFLDLAFTMTGRIAIGATTLNAVPANRRGAGLLFQDPLLFPHLSVGGNVAFGLPAVIRGAARRAKVEAGLAGIGLDGFYDRDPDTLSGGQKARVALIRTLLSDPRFLLLDEPFSKLDSDLRQQVRHLVFSQARAAGLPVVLVTHDRMDAEAAGGAVITVGAEESR